MKKLIKVVGAIIGNDNNEFLNHTHEYDGHSKSDYCKMYINIRCSEGSRTFLSIINNPLMIQKCFYF